MLIIVVKSSVLKIDSTFESVPDRELNIALVLKLKFIILLVINRRARDRKNTFFPQFVKVLLQEWI